MTCSADFKRSYSLPLSPSATHGASSSAMLLSIVCIALDLSSAVPPTIASTGDAAMGCTGGCGVGGAVVAVAVGAACLTGGGTKSCSQDGSMTCSADFKRSYSLPLSPSATHGASSSAMLLSIVCIALDLSSAVPPTIASTGDAAMGCTGGCGVGGAVVAVAVGAACLTGGGATCGVIGVGCCAGHVGAQGALGGIPAALL